MKTKYWIGIERHAWFSIATRIERHTCLSTATKSGAKLQVAVNEMFKGERRPVTHAFEGTGYTSLNFKECDCGCGFVYLKPGRPSTLYTRLIDFLMKRKPETPCQYREPMQFQS